MKSVGIIGAGKIAVTHLKSVNDNVSMKIIGIFDKFEVKSKNFARIYNIRQFNDVNELCKKSNIIIICSDNASHFSNLKIAIKNNCLILCEKPLVLNKNEYKKIEKLLNKYQSELFIAFNYRQLEIIKKILDLTKKNKLKKINFNFFKNSNLLKTKKTWKEFNYSKGTGGVIGDLGIHLIDSYRYLDNETESKYIIKKINKFRRRESLSKDVEEKAFFSIFFIEKKINLSISLSKISKNNDFEIIADFKDFTFYYKSEYKNYYLIKNKNNNQIKKKLKKLKNIDPKNEVYGWADSFRDQVYNIEKIYNNQKSNLCSFKDYKFHQILIDKLISHKTKII